MRRVLASNAKDNVFYTSFHACDRYTRGDEAMAAVRCPTLFLLGANDQMTPPKSAQSLISHARQPTVRTLQAGHSMLQEAPDQALDAIRSFLAVNAAKAPQAPALAA